MSSLNHKEVKEALLCNPNVQAEYDKRVTACEIQREIIRLRVGQGLSQQTLAQRIGTKQSATFRLESGDCNPSVEFLSKVAHALGKEFRFEFHKGIQYLGAVMPTVRS